jgi:Spy/CpxP family protein refolding chaperone
MVQTHVAMARAQVEAREVLTADQREHLETRSTQMMQGMMQGMMETHGSSDTGH